MADRGPNVQYDLRQLNFEETISADFVSNLCDIIITNFQEKRGDELVWDNPNIYPVSGYKTPVPENLKTDRLTQPNSPREQKAIRNIEELKDGVQQGKKITAATFNSLLANADTLNDSVKSLFSNNSYLKSMNKNIYDIINADDLKSLISNLNVISNNFDGTDSWWDANTDKCKKSCQVYCQTGCQTACQDGGGGCYSCKMKGLVMDVLWSAKTVIK
jgi:hypothetical protein